MPTIKCHLDDPAGAFDTVEVEGPFPPDYVYTLKKGETVLQDFAPEAQDIPYDVLGPDKDRIAWKRQSVYHNHLTGAYTAWYWTAPAVPR